MLQVTCIHVKGSVVISLYSHIQKLIIKNSNVSHARCVDIVWGHVVVIVYKHACHMSAS